MMLPSVRSILFGIALLILVELIYQFSDTDILHHNPLFICIYVIFIILLAVFIYHFNDKASVRYEKNLKVNQVLPSLPRDWNMNYTTLIHQSFLEFGTGYLFSLLFMIHKVFISPAPKNYLTSLLILFPLLFGIYAFYFELTTVQERFGKMTRRWVHSENNIQRRIRIK